MSQAAYMNQAVDLIRQLTGFAELGADVTIDGQPHPGAGQWFYAVHPGEWSGASEDADLDEYIGFLVTLSLKVGFSPKDRIGRKYIETQKGFEKNFRRVIVPPGLHRNDSLMNAVNVQILADDPVASQGFCEPALFLGMSGPPEFKGAEWFTSAEDTKFAYAGMAQTAVFGKARRVQGMNRGSITDRDLT